jgi:hypothetical protein
LGDGDTDAIRLALVLPLTARPLRGDTPVPYWWRAPEDGARGLGRRGWSARVWR